MFPSEVAIAAEDEGDGGRWLPLARALFAVAVCLHAAMFMSLFYGYFDGFFDNSDAFPQGIDFFSIYQSGTAIIRGTSIYEWTLPDRVPYNLPYRYVPFPAYTISLALNALPAWPAYWLWISLNEVMLVANAWLTYRLTPDRRWAWIAAGMWFAFSPLYLELYMGQWSFFMATLMLWMAALLLRDRPLMAGVPWTLSVMVKSSTGLLGPIFLRMRQWRLLIAAGLIIVALNGPYFLFYPDDARYFWDINFAQYQYEPERLQAVNSGDMDFVSYLRSVFATLGGREEGMPNWVETAVLFTVLGFSFAATLLPRRPHVLDLFAIWASSYFLIYFAWEHHYVMMLPPLVLLVALRPQYRALALVIFVLIALPTPYWLFERYLSDATPADLATRLRSPQFFWPQWAGMVHHASKPVPVFALWATLAYDQIAAWWAERRESAPSMEPAAAA